MFIFFLLDLLALWLKKPNHLWRQDEDEKKGDEFTRFMRDFYRWNSETQTGPNKSFLKNLMRH